MISTFYTHRSTPIGVLSLILVAVASIDDVSKVFRDLGMFIVAVVCGLVVLLLVALPALMFILTRKNPYSFLLHITRPILIAFAATST